MDKLGILIPTFNRASIVVETVRLIRQHILSPLPYEFYVGCDGTDDTPARLHGDAVIFPGATGSLGANLNRLISAARDDGCMYLWQQDDDHQPIADVNLFPHIALMESDPRAGWVRMMGVGAHHYVADLIESYWYVRWDSPEMYITSNRPHVKRADWVDTFGWYPEGVRLGLTEEGYCHQCRNLGIAGGVPRVVVPLTHNERDWNHTGESLQLKGL